MRLTELKLPLEHTPEQLRAAIIKRLGITPDELLSFQIYRRSVDARKSSTVILTYTIDVTLKNEQAMADRLQGIPHIGQTPDTQYHFVTQAPATQKYPRPVVIGTGPCGLFAGLLLSILFGLAS